MYVTKDCGMLCERHGAGGEHAWYPYRERTGRVGRPKGGVSKPTASGKEKKEENDEEEDKVRWHLFMIVSLSVSRYMYLRGTWRTVKRTSSSYVNCKL